MPAQPKLTETFVEHLRWEVQEYERRRGQPIALDRLDDDTRVYRIGKNFAAYIGALRQMVPAQQRAFLAWCWQES
jgi:hypothetical protein